MTMKKENGTYKALAQAVMRMKRPHGICNDYSDLEWRLTKAVEMGYKMAVGEIVGNIISNTNKSWK